MNIMTLKKLLVVIIIVWMTSMFIGFEVGTYMSDVILNDVLEQQKEKDTFTVNGVIYEN